MNRPERRRPDVPVLFISSTSEDLPSHRAAARDAAIAAGFLPRMMEYFAASGERPPLNACLAQVGEADVLMVIAAYRYGWMPAEQPAGDDKSITWLECEQAVAAGSEVLAFLVEERHPWPEELRDEYQVTAAVRAGAATPELLTAVQRNVSRLRDFKSWLNGRAVRAQFTTAEDLRAKVTQALYDWRRRHFEIETTPAAPQRPPADPTKYLRDLLARTAYIDIRGLQVGTGRVHRFPIEELYINLTTTSAPHEAGQTGSKKSPSSKREPNAEFGWEQRAGDVPLHAALAERRLVVVGDPGSGKTTFLWRVACALCQSLLGEVPNAAQSRLGISESPLPIYVRIADLAEHIAQARPDRSRSKPTTLDAAAWLPHYLATISQDAWGLDEEFFREGLQSGRCLVLLDGLDEAPHRVSRQSAARLIENLARAYDQCRIVVTTRPAAYADEAILADFALARIEPLDHTAIDTFVARWCQALYSDSPSDAERHCRELVAAMHERFEIRRMARNPVMLTALAVVHWNERRLPEQRADLYDSIITWLARSREQRPARLTADRAVAVLQELALAMQNHPDGRQVQVPKRWAAEALAAELEPGAATRHSLQQADRFLNEEELDSGIIVGRGNEVRFWHLTFQEFLAAKAIAGRPDDQQLRVLMGQPKRLYEPEWREVVLLLAGILHHHGRLKVDRFFQAALDDLGERPSLALQARCAGLLGAVIRDLRPLDYQPADTRYEELLDTVLGIFDRQRSESVPLQDRIEAAEALGQAGDPRLDPAHPQRRVHIPAGPFLMGSQRTDPSQPNHDPETYERAESPVHEVHLDAFQIARFPVTVAEYQPFVEHGGYAEAKWWSAGGFGQFSAPEDWEAQLVYPNRPVVNVSWFESAAYCHWAGARLPTEAEWERAARGTEGRKFPWGNEAAEPSRLNFDESKLGRATPVGIYPLGATPDGIMDLAGNVWEWCQDWYNQDYYANASRVNPTGPERGQARVLRGGSWDYQAWDCRAASRAGLHPDDRSNYVGFRFVYSRQDS